MKVLLWLFLVAIILIAACGPTTAPTPTPEISAPVQATPTLAPSPKATASPTPAATPIAVSPRDPAAALVTKTPTPASPLSQDGVVVQVVRVIDGDTIEVVFNDGAVDTVRLMGIDTPETFSSNKPDEYGEITDIACLDEWGAQATLDVTDTLFGEIVILSRDPVADVRGSFGRLLAYVEFKGRDFNAALVEEGLARVYTEGDSSRKAEYLALQEVARREAVGLWQCEHGEPSTPDPK